MRRLLPSKAEILFFGAAAIICAVIASLVDAPEVGLAALSIPVFIAASLLGFQRYRNMLRIQTSAAE